MFCCIQNQIQTVLESGWKRVPRATQGKSIHQLLPEGAQHLLPVHHFPFRDQKNTLSTSQDETLSAPSNPLLQHLFPDQHSGVEPPRSGLERQGLAPKHVPGLPAGLHTPAPPPGSLHACLRAPAAPALDVHGVGHLRLHLHLRHSTAGSGAAR